MRSGVKRRRRLATDGAPMRYGGKTKIGPRVAEGPINRDRQFYRRREGDGCTTAPLAAGEALCDVPPGSGLSTHAIAHEFNNLLTVISGNLDLIAMRADDPRTMRQVAAAQAAADRAAKLTRQLLAVPRS